MKSLLLAGTFVVAALLLGCLEANASSNSTNPLGQPVVSAANTTATPAATANPTIGGFGSVKVGDHVAVDYIGTLDDGTVFDTSIESVARTKGTYVAGRPYTPLEFTVGAGQMIKGFDQGVVGMRIGQTKIVHMTAVDAYGEVDASLVVPVPIKDLTDAGITPKVGLSVSTGTGQQGKITALNATTATVDFNHPLAGKALNFAITLKSIG